MKHILFLLSILLGQPLFCQAQRLGDFLTNMVAPLGKTEITSNFLWDKDLNGLAEPHSDMYWNIINPYLRRR